MTRQNPPLLWVLNFLAPTFELFGQKLTITGDLLIASRQLWSLLCGDIVRSALIGPGVVKGQVIVKGHPVDVEFLVGAILFDPTEMRPGKPIPLLDILNPEVVDPLSESTPEQVQEIIQTLLVKKGSVSESGQILKVSAEGALPQTLIIEQQMIGKNITFVSGKNKARFLLGGQKNRLYTPFKEALLHNRFSVQSKIWTFRLDLKKFDAYRAADFKEWVIIEMQTDTRLDSIDTPKAMDDEYNSVLKYLIGNREYFIY
ncbi:MAG: hypothetical protein ACFFDP_08875 [Promethearchaeota archaeon]